MVYNGLRNLIIQIRFENEIRIQIWILPKWRLTFHIQIRIRSQYKIYIRVWI